MADAASNTASGSTGTSTSTNNATANAVNNNSMINISRRSAGMQSFKVMDILQRANEIEQQQQQLALLDCDDDGKIEGEEDNLLLPVLHCEVGQPETGAPQRVAQAAVDALTTAGGGSTTARQGQCQVLGYTNAFGLVSLRTEIARHYQRHYFNNNLNNNDNHSHVPPLSLSLLSTNQIVITTGSSGAFLLAFTACFDVGDVVALASAGYPCYRNILSALGCVCAHIPINAQFKLTAVELQAEIDQRRSKNQAPIQGLVLSSPSNPTGAMLTRTELQDLCRLCDHYNIQFISDEIYHGISYGIVHEATALQYSNRVIVINSFSKYYSSTFV
jgi:aspartate/methionine/tyrosine aminotransferase